MGKGWKRRGKERAHGTQLGGTRLRLLLSDKLFPAFVHVFLTRTTCLLNNYTNLWDSHPPVYARWFRKAGILDAFRDGI